MITTNMKPDTFLIALGFAVAAALAPSATAQQITGKQLPPPAPFGGVIKQNAKDSKSWLPPRVVPPNVLLIMTDDSGYGVPGTFAAGK